LRSVPDDSREPDPALASTTHAHAELGERAARAGPGRPGARLGQAVAELRVHGHEGRLRDRVLEHEPDGRVQHLRVGHVAHQLLQQPLKLLRRQLVQDALDRLDRLRAPAARPAALRGPRRRDGDLAVLCRLS